MEAFDEGINYIKVVEKLLCLCPAGTKTTESSLRFNSYANGENAKRKRHVRR